MSETDLRKDMSFVGQGINVLNRSLSKLETYEEIEERQKEKKLKNLIKLSKKFRDIDLIKCPAVFSKAKENNSHCDPKLKTFMWTVRLNFYSGESKKLSLLSSFEFDDNAYSLEDLAVALVNERNVVHLDNSEQMVLKDHLLRNRRSFDQIYFLTKGQKCLFDEQREFSGEKHFKVDQSQKLADFLKGKTIFEYPEFSILI